MDDSAFDLFANDYDKWFLSNKNVLASEVALLARFLQSPGRSLSVGCGTGLFERLLEKDYGIRVTHGIEPAEGMAEIARQRGLDVRIGTAEQSHYGDAEYDTIIFNGTPSYITQLDLAFNKAFAALRQGGRVVVLDVPKESSYALLYNLAKEVGTWDNYYFVGAKPLNAYPISFVQESRWRSTPEKVELLTAAGFQQFEFAQTLTRHPVYSDEVFEEPVEGYDRGDYVAICGVKL